MFSWRNFLESHNIEYVSRGYGVSRDNITINCPYCGAEGRAFHLAISEKGKGWACWRNPSYKGRYPHRLIMDLIGCSFSEAKKIVGSDEGVFVSTEVTFVDDCFRRLGRVVDNVFFSKRRSLEFLSEFYDASLSLSFVHQYLKRRE